MVNASVLVVLFKKFLKFYVIKSLVLGYFFYH